MPKCFVQLSSLVALIRVNNQYWSMQKDDGPIECSAPQMFNVGSCQFYDEQELNDEYPFHKIRKLFKAKRNIRLMIFCIQTILDDSLSLETQMLFLDILLDLEIADSDKKGFDWLSETMLATPLPESAKIKIQVFNAMPTTFQDLFRRVFKKFRDVDL